ncbi:hypothetical protein EZS27_011666 [termite gut metagenome]|uniref:Uncharacterized protein n=1 Tax=termite gut metagenome TaxID=433724 RepID=A0A5J4S424_9ZZZZ
MIHISAIFYNSIHLYVHCERDDYFSSPPPIFLCLFHNNSYLPPAFTFKPFSVVVFAIRFTMTSKLINGLALQFMVIKENKRCSILFPLPVPGGKWHTLISKPVSVADCCHSFFRKRLEELLLPTPSAVIISFFESG